MNEMFWSSNDLEREQGYILEEEHYKCLLCDYMTEVGFIYPKEELYVDAKKQMMLHIEEAHGGVFNYLLGFDKKLTGLSEQQRTILQLFHKGLTDYDIKNKLNVGSVSTIRNHRYMIKEKEKQAKTTVTIMGLLNKSMDIKNMPVKPHKTATMVDNRYDVTVEESIQALEKYFPEGTDGQLKTFSVKEKYKLIILREIIKRFEFKKLYSEKEVDVILKKIYPEDHVVLRRYLIQYGFMSREKDGSAYWRKEKDEKKKAKQKDRKTNKRKELVQAYVLKEAEKGIESGVYQIENTVNGKVFIDSARGIHKLNGLTFQLNTGSFTNRALQKDWTQLGEDQFEIKVLEFFSEDDEINVTKKLRELERSYKEKLQPYGDKGYHKQSKK
ncbi:MAG: DUF2087 domain-containing protein [Clostridiales bacterium]|nr:DUF2087 domain-containing protein [Clostridiales bacterium]